MKKEKTAAVVTINRPDKFNAKGRKAVANWIRKQAAFLEVYGKDMGPSFRARYIYTPKNHKEAGDGTRKDA